MVSLGCKNCYAMRMAARFAKDGWSRGLIDLKTKKWSREGRLATHKLAEPLTWREPSTVFVNSMSDLFWEKFTNEEIAAVFGIMAACQRHTFIIATKRASRMRGWYQWFDDVIEPHAMEWSGRDCAVSIDDARSCERGLTLANAAASLMPEGEAGWLMRLGDRMADAQKRDTDWWIPWPPPNVWLLVSVENQEMARRAHPAPSGHASGGSRDIGRALA